MGLFDTLKSMAMGQLGGEGDDAGAQPSSFLGQALANTPFGGASGLVEHLAQSGLGPELQSMASGGGSFINPDMLRGVLNDDHVRQMAEQFGVEPDQVFNLISEHLPGLAQQAASQGADLGQADADGDSDDGA